MKAIPLSIRTIIPALLISGIALHGCSGAGSSDSKKDSEISFNQIDIEKAYSLTNSASDFDVDSDLTVGCRATIILPTAYLGQDITAFRDSIMKTAFDTIAEGPNAAIEHYFKKQCEDMGYTPATLSVSKATSDSLETGRASLNNYDGFVGINGEIASMAPEYISYSLTMSAYYPRAAHGMYATYYITYASAARKVVTLDDLFTPEGLKALPAVIRSRAKVMRGYIGTTSIDELPAGHNFYINSFREIVFAYQPYEVASYAQGRINIPIEPYTVANYLTALGSKVLLSE